MGGNPTMRRPVAVAMPGERRQRVALSFDAGGYMQAKKWALVRAPKITKGGG
jgi:hypothetical protein